jgi:hypothetical protein
MDTLDAAGHSRVGVLSYRAEAGQLEAERQEKVRISEEAALTIAQAVSVLQTAPAETAAAAAAVVMAVAKHRKLEADIEMSVKKLLSIKDSEVYITRLVGSPDGADNDPLGVTMERFSSL